MKHMTGGAGRREDSFSILEVRFPGQRRRAFAGDQRLHISPGLVPCAQQGLGSGFDFVRRRRGKIPAHRNRQGGGIKSTKGHPFAFHRVQQAARPLRP